MVGFSQSLRAEARQYGITVCTLCPGYIRTNIHKTTANVPAFMDSPRNRRMNAEMRFPTAEECVEGIMRGVARGQGIIIAPRRQAVYRPAPGFIPAMFARVIRTMKRQA